GVRLAVATARPSALDVDAQMVVRYAPGEEAALLEQLARGEGELARFVRGGGEDIVILWGERLGSAAALLPSVAEQLALAERPGAGLMEIPAGANGRGLREAGVLPDAGPGYAELDAPGRVAAQIAQAAVDGGVTALHLFETDPVRDQPGRGLWEAALHRAGLVVAHASVLTEGIEEHANVVFPADSYAEKEGTVVHPDGRLQRLRTAIAHPREVRAGWWVIAEIAKRAGLDMGILTSSMAFGQLVDAVPFYEGVTLEEIGGQGVRWQEREQGAAKFPGPSAPEPRGPSAPPPAPTSAGAEPAPHSVGPESGASWAPQGGA